MTGLIAGGIILAALVVYLGRAFVRVYLKYRGNRLITCPENQCPAGVRVNAAHALSSALEGSLDLRLKSCSRWPEKQDCGQECLQQIEASPEDCLVRNLLNKWYAGKNCAICCRPIGEIHWADHQPALMDAAHKSVDWRDIPAETLPEVLRSCRPVCWHCHVVNRVVLEHPELIVDRSRGA